MHFDALTLACVTDEIKRLLPGRVQQVLLADEYSIGLEIYAAHQRHYLLLSADPQAGRIQLTDQKLRRGTDTSSPLLLLLRKYVRDSVLIDTVQPDPTERVLQLHFSHAEHGPTTLVAEIMGQRSNLLFLNPAQKILDCQHRIGQGAQVQRVLWPGRPYTPPLPQNKLAPLDDGSPDYYDRLGALLQAEGKLWKVLTVGIAGTSPTLARELAWRATGDIDATAQAVNVVGLAQALQALWAPVQTGEWQPGVWLEEQTVVGFSAYPAHVRGEFVPTASMSAALEQFYTRPPQERAVIANDGYASLRATVAAELRRATVRIQRQLEALASDEPLPGAAEQIRTQAEWLLALNSQVQPDQTVLNVDLGEDETLQIQLDPAKMPVEQAQQMFKTAAKWGRAAQAIPVRRAKLHQDLEFLAQLGNDLRLAENQPEIAAVREEIEQAGFLPQSQKKVAKTRVGPAASQPLRYISPQGFAILVGRNARQNDRVTFTLAKAEDLWLHVRGAPGAHVVVRSGGQPLTDETLKMAAQLAGYYSSQRGERAVEVAFTRGRFVTRVPGGRPGQVYIRHEAVVTVAAELPEQTK